MCVCVCVCVYVCVQWTVQGKLRIGFFTVQDILLGEEITFDYQFQRFGWAEMYYLVYYVYYVPSDAACVCAHAHM